MSILYVGRVVIMAMWSVVDKSYHLIQQMLKKLGNDQPTQEQETLMESLLIRQSVSFRLVFHDALTSREVSCLLLAAKGMTMEETASILNVKYSSVETWYKNIKRKLDCRSITQAVFEGIRYGYLLPKEELKQSVLETIS